MKKAELLQWLQDENQQLKALIDQISPARMVESGVAGFWSMKDIVAHLTGWNRRLVANIEAAQRGVPEPPPPWPAHLQTDDEVNVWIYEANKGLSVHEVLKEAEQDFQQLLAVVDEFPEDIPIDTIHQGEREYYLVILDDQRIHPGELFDHYHDDHEDDIRAWLAQEAQQ